MRLDFLDRRRAERFAELLDETGGGRRHHSRGPANEELAELVAIGHKLSAINPRTQAGPEFRRDVRAILMAAAERDGIGATATESEHGSHAAQPQRRAGLSFSGRRIRARGAIVVGVAAGALAVSGISAASDSAAPGDALYGVKRSAERAQLAMAGSDITRGQLSLDFARTRLAEATALAGGTAGGFGAVLNDMDADTRQGVKLLNEAAVTRKDPSPLGRVDTFVTGQRQIFEPFLGRLSAADRERANRSLNLLDKVQDRSEELKAGLTCGTVSRSGTDSLGPRLHNCVVGQGSSTTAERPKTHSQKQGAKTGTGSPGSADTGSGEVQPEKTGPAGDPAAPATTRTDDSRQKSVPGTTSPSPDADADVVEEPPADKDTADKGIIGGLLDGIFN